MFYLLGRCGWIFSYSRRGKSAVCTKLSTSCRIPFLLRVLWAINKILGATIKSLSGFCRSRKHMVTGIFRRTAPVDSCSVGLWVLICSGFGGTHEGQGEWDFMCYGRPLDQVDGTQGVYLKSDQPWTSPLEEDPTTVPLPHLEWSLWMLGLWHMVSRHRLGPALSLFPLAASHICLLTGTDTH